MALPAPRLHSPRIARGGRPLALVVEDDPDAAAIAEAMLVQLGFGCQSAGDGHEALAAAAGSLPDLVLLDVHLPGIDGIGVVRTLRRVRELVDVPVVATSALYARESAQARQLRALGVEQYLSKPFGLQQLRGALEQAGASPRARAPGPATDPSLEPAAGLRTTLVSNGRIVDLRIRAVDGAVVEATGPSGILSPSPGARLEIRSRGDTVLARAWAEFFAVIPQGKRSTYRLSVRAQLPPDGLQRVAQLLL